MGLVWQQRRQLLLAGASLLVSTASNLAAPVLTGMLMETLVKQKPVEEYAKVRGTASCMGGGVHKGEGGRCTHGASDHLWAHSTNSQQLIMCMPFSQLLVILMFGYVVEPLLTKVYIENAIRCKGRGRKWG